MIWEANEFLFLTESSEKVGVDNWSVCENSNMSSGRKFLHLYRAHHVAESAEGCASAKGWEVEIFRL